MEAAALRSSMPNVIDVASYGAAPNPSVALSASGDMIPSGKAPPPDVRAGAFAAIGPNERRDD